MGSFKCEACAANRPSVSSSRNNIQESKNCISKKKLDLWTFFVGGDFVLMFCNQKKKKLSKYM